MSSKYENNDYPSSYGFFNRGSCCCNFPALVILILILLQFGGNKFFGEGPDCEEGHGKKQLVDNSILFIIALFYLSCCNPCKEQFV